MEIVYIVSALSDFGISQLDCFYHSSPHHGANIQSCRYAQDAVSPSHLQHLWHHDEDLNERADINEASPVSLIKSRTVHPVREIWGEILVENSSADCVLVNRVLYLMMRVGSWLTSH